MQKLTTKWYRALFALTLLMNLSGCGYNDIQTSDENINAAWSEVINQYQRRADLVPNLAATVNRYAQHEHDVLTEVASARSRVGSMQVTSDMAKNPEALMAFDNRERALSGALSRLMVVAENYPQLKADSLFRDLEVQLEGTENRITGARGRYIQAVKTYNIEIRQFPGVLVAKAFGYTARPNFGVSDTASISTAPKLDFPVQTPTQTPAR